MGSTTEKQKRPRRNLTGAAFCAVHYQPPPRRHGRRGGRSSADAVLTAESIFICKDVLLRWQGPPTTSPVLHALNDYLGSNPGPDAGQEAAFLKALRLREGRHVLRTGGRVHITAEYYLFLQFWA